jgi:heat-inducible transcriptional repressor
MVELTKKGYLRQSHTSAGRAPTPLAFRFYIQELMRPKELSVADEVAVKERIWDYRYEYEKLLREATRELARRLKTLALSATEEGDIFYAGAANLLDMPEFYDIDLTKTMLSILDQFDYLEGILQRAMGEEDIHILLGDELGNRYLESCGIVFTHFSTGKKHKGAIGVLGPSRLNYPYVIPTVRYFGDLINEIAKNW